MITIGIDPDTAKSGIAVFDHSNNHLELRSLSFFELYDYLSVHREVIKKVKVEGGWLNAKSNFRFTKSQGIGERIAKNVGSNHEAGRKIVEMCEYLQLPAQVIKPHRLVWSGPGGKISHRELLAVLRAKDISLLQKTTSQDARDSALICLL